MLGFLLLACRAGADVHKEVSIWVARDVAPGPKVRVTVNTTNVPTVQMAAYRLSDTAPLLTDTDLSRIKIGRPEKQWSVGLVTPKETRNHAQRDVFRSRQVNLPILSPGPYLLVARAGDIESRALVNVTNLAVIVKRSSKRTLVWTTDFTTGRTIEGAKVTLYRVIAHTSKDKAGKKHTSYTFDVVESFPTRRDGTCMIASPAADDQAIIVTKGHDTAVIKVGNNRRDGILKSHFQTDRPIYRPGQTVYYKAILRRTNGRGYAPVVKTKCNVQVRDSEDNVIDESNVITNDIGTLSGRFDIPTEAAVGPYSIVVNVDHDQVYETFTVAEYRKPDFKVTVGSVQKRYLSGDNVTFIVDSAYYFGAPVQQATVQYKVRRSGMWYWDNGPSWWESNDGNLYSSDTYRSDDFVAEGTVYTDDSGKVTIPIKTKRDAPDSSYSIECTVRDSSRREVQGSSSVSVYAAGIRLGMRTDVLCAPLGSNIPLKLGVVDLDGKPTAATVTLDVQGYVWNKKAQCLKPKSFGKTTVDVPASGIATAKVPAKTEGDIVVIATAADSTGRKTRASLSLWIAGANTKVEKEQESKYPTVSLKLDRKTYGIGDTVKAWITTNTLDHPILVTAEGLDIWKYEVLPTGRKVYDWNLKTSIEMSPNAFIEVAQWAKNGLVSGSEEVPIPDETRRLNVSIDPERKVYRPGDPASYVIKTTSKAGKPVPAEVSVAVVDESIYAMRPDSTPDLLSTFWATRPNSVITRQSAPEEVSGGAYQRVNSVAPVRQKFVDTAYWNAHVMTGADGTAKISFETPGNLTTWRATARAITADTNVGIASVSTQASRPVMLRLAVPRQFVKGDKLKLIGTIVNHSGASHVFETSISAVGVKIEEMSDQKVTISNGKQATVEWTVVADTLPQSGFASIKARAIASDARPDQGEELSDALQSDVRVVPDGIQDRIATGGAMNQEKTAMLNLPTDRIEPAGVVKITARSGLQQVVSDMAKNAVGYGRWSSLNAADELLALALSGKTGDSKEIRETLMSLYRYRNSTGAWGWWSGQSDPEITAAIMADIARARDLGVTIPKKIELRSAAGAKIMFDSENLWERAALLASGIEQIGTKGADTLLDKVHDKGKPLSPYAELCLAQAYLKMGNRDWAMESAKSGLAGIIAGPDIAYVPAGHHLGWSATTVETTAQALLTTVTLKMSDNLQPKLAQWLVTQSDRSWMSQHETVLTAYALKTYADRHPQSTKVGSLDVSVNGKQLPTAVEKLGAVQVTVPSAMLKDGENTFLLKRSEPGEIFYSIEARVYHPATVESAEGMRVMRRYEVMDAAGLWSEMKGPIKPSQGVRCTVVVWPNDRPDMIRIVEPIPSGFEYVDSDSMGCYGLEEVRDGAVIDYMLANGNPTYFRYYMQAESEGDVSALPATAEAIRRPDVRANSQITKFEVRK